VSFSSIALLVLFATYLGLSFRDLRRETWSPLRLVLLIGLLVVSAVTVAGPGNAREQGSARQASAQHATTLP